MSQNIICAVCGRIAPKYSVDKNTGKDICKVCYSRPYIEEYRQRPEYPQKNRIYQESHRIKKILSEMPES